MELAVTDPVHETRQQCSSHGANGSHHFSNLNLLSWGCPFQTLASRCA